MRELRVRLCRIVAGIVSAGFVLGMLGCGGGGGGTVTSTRSTLTASISFTPSAITFGTQTLNTTGTTKTVELKNTGDGPAAISSIQTSGDFSQTNTCGTSLAAGASCVVTLTFFPTAAGARTGLLSISDSGIGSPHSVSLSGTGVANSQFGVSPTQVSFGSVVVGKSNSQTIQFSNTGTDALTISSASTSGPGFGLSGLAIPATVAAGQQVTFTVTFTPTNAGSASGSVLLRVNGGGTDTVIPMTGTAVAAMSHTVSLTWTASASAVVGYNVYRSAQQSGSYAKLNANIVPVTTFSDSGVVAGQTYWYAVTSVAAGSVESGYSSATGVVIPGP